MSWFGRVKSGFSDVIAESSQLVMVPRKISATTSPVSLRPVSIPGRLYATVIAPMVSGM